MKLGMQFLAHAKTENLVRLAKYIGLSIDKAPKREEMKRQWLIRKIAKITDAR